MYCAVSPPRNVEVEFCPLTLMNPAKVEVAPMPLILMSVPKVDEADVKRLPVMSTV